MSEAVPTIRPPSTRYEGGFRFWDEARVTEWRESERTDGLSVEREGDEARDATVVSESAPGGSAARVSHSRATLPLDSQTRLRA